MSEHRQPVAKNPFQRAKRHRARARIAIAGPSGAGKSLTSLMIAKGLGGPIALIDSEPGASEWYAADFEFDSLAPANNDPEIWIHYIEEAGRLGYNVVILDSLSALWSGSGGLLEMVDKEKSKSTTRNLMSPWMKATPIQNRLVESIRRSPCHVIATLRVKTEWVMENREGKQVPRKIGLGYVQRDQIEYEFDLVFDIDIEHRIKVSNRRGFMLLDGYEQERPGAELGEAIRKYLEEAGDEDRPAPPSPPARAEPVPPPEAPQAERGRARTASPKDGGPSYQSDDQEAHVAQILALAEDYGYERPAIDGNAPVVVLPRDVIAIYDPGTTDTFEWHQINLASISASDRLKIRKYLEANLLAAIHENVREATIDLYGIDPKSVAGGIQYPEEVWTALNSQPRKLDPRTLDEGRSRRLLKILRGFLAARAPQETKPESEQTDF